MDIFRSRFYRINVTLLSLVGLWPYQKFKSWQQFQQIIIQIIVLTVMLSLTIKLFEIWGDFDIMIECITPIGVAIAAITKFYNSIYHRKNMMKLLETIDRDWTDLKNKKEIEIITKYAETGRNLTIIYTVLLYSTLFMYLMIPLLPRILDVIVPLNNSRPPVYLYHSEYYVDPEKYFMWISLHTYTCSLLTTTIIMASDTMFGCYVMHVCGILAVIRYRLENLTSKYSKSNVGFYTMSKEDDDRCHREIVLCIDLHYRIIEVANIIESSYSISYLLVLGVAVAMLSMSGVQLLIKFGQVEEVIRLVTFNAGQFTHLLFNSWPCQKLIDESVKLRESLYIPEWYSLSEGNKRLLRFVMLQTLEPQKITAGKLYVMSIENFGVVIQTSMSYFTMFASIR